MAAAVAAREPIRRDFDAASLAAAPPAPILDPKLQDEVRLTLREAARRRTGGSTTLVTLPGVQSLSALTRYIEGGRDRVIELVQMAVLNNDPIATAWWQVYAELPSYQRAIVIFDDVCAASGVKARDFCVMLVSTAMEFGADAGNLIASITHPKILDAMVRSAERIDGPHAEIAIRDRHAFLQGRGVGFLPTPKGAVQVNVSATAQAAAAASEPTVPKFADSVGGVRSALAATVPRALPAPAAELDPFDQLIGEAIEGEVVPVGLDGQ